MENQKYAPSAPRIAMDPSQMMVSRIAGPSRRCISSFIRLRGTAVRYHWAWDRPRSTARLDSGPTSE